MTTIAIPRILRKAADVIEQRGWYQGGYVPDGLGDLDTCKVCVPAAINVAVGYAPDTELWGEGDVRADAARDLSEHLGLTALAEAHADDPNAWFDAESIGSVVGDLWNDSIAKSATEVTTALRECAADLEGGAR